MNELEKLARSGRGYATAVRALTSTDSYVDDLASQFLKSEYAGEQYGNWPLDRRLEGFLRGVADRVSASGDLFNIILDRVMVFIGYMSDDRMASSIPQPASNRTKGFLRGGVASQSPE